MITRFTTEWLGETLRGFKFEEKEIYFVLRDVASCLGRNDKKDIQRMKEFIIKNFGEDSIRKINTNILPEDCRKSLNIKTNNNILLVKNDDMIIKSTIVKFTKNSRKLKSEYIQKLYDLFDIPIIINRPLETQFVERLLNVMYNYNIDNLEINQQVNVDDKYRIDILINAYNSVIVIEYDERNHSYSSYNNDSDRMDYILKALVRNKLKDKGLPDFVMNKEINEIIENMYDYNVVRVKQDEEDSALFKIGYLINCLQHKEDMYSKI